MPAADMGKYSKIKSFLLSEFKFHRSTNLVLIMRLKFLTKRGCLFAARLRNLLLYYLRSRGVDTFEDLCSLLVADKLE